MQELAISIPENMESMQLPDPDLLDYYRYLEDRTIFINGCVDDFIESFVMQILAWNKEDKGKTDRKPIKIFINSDGGALAPALNLIDVILLSKTPVYTIGMSRCYSSGGLLLMAGHKRFIFPTTTYLVHDGDYGVSGSTGKFLDSAKFTEQQEDRLANYVTSHSSIDAATYEKNYRKDWFMFAEDILKYHVADEIVTDLDQIV